MNMTKVLQEHRNANVSQLMDLLSDEGRQLLSSLTDACSIMDPVDVHLIFAMLFGSLAFDAEMSNPEVSYEDRLKLFEIHAKTTYDQTAQYSRDNNVYPTQG